MRVLVISSWVAAGHVGLSAAQPALQRMGAEVIGLPTTILSNHPGFEHVAGAPVDTAQIVQMGAAIAANGWPVDTVLTGYMPSAQHVEAAMQVISALAPGRVVVDPVLGDDPKGLYVPAAAASAVRDVLVPRADVTTPNRFELSWLTDAPVTTQDEARAAAAQIKASVLLTSPPVPGQTGCFDTSAGTFHAAPLLDGVPHGVGDVFAALIAGGMLPADATAALARLAKASAGQPHLRIADSKLGWI